MHKLQPLSGWNGAGYATVIIFLIILILSFLLPEPAVGQKIYLPTQGDRHGLNLYSEDREKYLGDKYAQVFEDGIRILEDRAVNDYLSNIVHKVQRNSETQLTPLVKIVFDPDVNAYALPGHLYVNTGLILTAENEAELAGALAHELAHVAAHHGTRGLTRQRLWSVPWLPLCGIGLCESSLFARLSSLTAGIPMRQFSRNSENEADRMAVTYLYSSGYDPLALAEFLQQIPDESKRSNFFKRPFDTHPPLPNRVRQLRKEVTMLPRSEDALITDTSDFQEIKKHVSERVQQEYMLLKNRPFGWGTASPQSSSEKIE